MNRNLTIAAVLLSPLCLLADSRQPACGQASGTGTIICCNQHVEVRGNWIGGDRKANCEEWARKNARARRELCVVECLSKDVKERYCMKEDCKENPKPPGSVYVGIVPAISIHAQPSETSEAVSSPFYGARLRYREVRKVDGRTWYRIEGPPYKSGWVSEEEVFCELPPQPPPPPPDYSCKKNPKGQGAMFAMSTKSGAAQVYSEPTGDSKVIASPANGTRMVYREVRQVNDETWFYVAPPGRSPGWMNGIDLVCSRPGDPIPPKINKPLDPGLANERPTAAISSAGRG
jgi:hypothetical protein